MSDIYAERGYGSRPLGFGAKIGVVVVDFQRGFIDPDSPWAARPWWMRPCATPCRSLPRRSGPGCR
ncbi:hypothetical protein ACFQU2_20965 [Siccirubricoccus deserti]